MNLDQILKARKLLESAAVPDEDRYIATVDENGEPVIIDLASLSLAKAIVEAEKAKK